MTIPEQKSSLLALLHSEPMSMKDIDREIETLRRTCPDEWGDFPSGVPALLWQLASEGKVERTDDGMWKWLSEKKQTRLC